MLLAAVQIAGKPGPQDDDALIDGLRQRARLLELILADLLGPQSIVRSGLLPAPLVAGLPESVRLGAWFSYAADLARCPDGVWRVSFDAAGLGDHPCARLLEGAALACFLPALSRVLLGEPLRLASLPSRWLGDPGALAHVAADRHRWAILDALGRSPAAGLADMAPPQRIALQEQVEAAPWRFVARLLVAGEAGRVAMVRQACGTWAVHYRAGC